ncbi:hypothetical protein GQR58_001255 [Nymphon striatum]|nr:hypothetical protein GQR58_001255 [Nymphon striatum]
MILIFIFRLLEDFGVEKLIGRKGSDKERTFKMFPQQCIVNLCTGPANRGGWFMFLSMCILSTHAQWNRQRRGFRSHNNDLKISFTEHRNKFSGNQINNKLPIFETSHSNNQFNPNNRPPNGGDIHQSGNQHRDQFKDFSGRRPRRQRAHNLQGGNQRQSQGGHNRNNRLHPPQRNFRRFQNNRHRFNLQAQGTNNQERFRQIPQGGHRQQNNNRNTQRPPNGGQGFRQGQGQFRHGPQFQNRPANGQQSGHKQQTHGGFDQQIPFQNGHRPQQSGFRQQTQVENGNRQQSEIGYGQQSNQLPSNGHAQQTQNENLPQVPQQNGQQNSQIGNVQQSQDSYNQPPQLPQNHEQLDGYIQQSEGGFGQQLQTEKDQRSQREYIKQNEHVQQPNKQLQSGFEQYQQDGSVQQSPIRNGEEQVSYQTIGQSGFQQSPTGHSQQGKYEQQTGEGPTDAQRATNTNFEQQIGYGKPGKSGYDQNAKSESSPESHTSYNFPPNTQQQSAQNNDGSPQNTGHYTPSNTNFNQFIQHENRPQEDERFHTNSETEIQGGLQHDNGVLQISQFENSDKGQSYTEDDAEADFPQQEGENGHAENFGPENVQNGYDQAAQTYVAEDPTNNQISPGGNYNENSRLPDSSPVFKSEKAIPNQLEIRQQNTKKDYKKSGYSNSRSGRNERNFHGTFGNGDRPFRVPKLDTTGWIPILKPNFRQNRNNYISGQPFQNKEQPQNYNLLQDENKNPWLKPPKKFQQSYINTQLALPEDQLVVDFGPIPSSSYNHQTIPAQSVNTIAEVNIQTSVNQEYQPESVHPEVLKNDQSANKPFSSFQQRNQESYRVNIKEPIPNNENPKRPQLNIDNYRTTETDEQIRVNQNGIEPQTQNQFQIPIDLNQTPNENLAHLQANQQGPGISPVSEQIQGTYNTNNNQVLTNENIQLNGNYGATQENNQLPLDINLKRTQFVTQDQVEQHQNIGTVHGQVQGDFNGHFNQVPKDENNQINENYQVNQNNNIAGPGKGQQTYTSLQYQGLNHNENVQNNQGYASHINQGNSITDASGNMDSKNGLPQYQNTNNNQLQTSQNNQGYENQNINLENGINPEGFQNYNGQNFNNNPEKQSVQAHENLQVNQDIGISTVPKQLPILQFQNQNDNRNHEQISQTNQGYDNFQANTEAGYASHNNQGNSITDISGNMDSKNGLPQYQNTNNNQLQTNQNNQGYENQNINLENGINPEEFQNHNGQNGDTINNPEGHSVQEYGNFQVNQDIGISTVPKQLPILQFQNKNDNRNHEQVSQTSQGYDNFQANTETGYASHNNQGNSITDISGNMDSKNGLPQYQNTNNNQLQTSQNNQGYENQNINLENGINPEGFQNYNGQNVDTINNPEQHSVQANENLPANQDIGTSTVPEQLPILQFQNQNGNRNHGQVSQTNQGYDNFQVNTETGGVPLLDQFPGRYNELNYQTPKELMKQNNNQDYQNNQNNIQNLNLNPYNQIKNQNDKENNGQVQQNKTPNMPEIENHNQNYEGQYIYESEIKEQNKTSQKVNNETKKLPKVEQPKVESFIQYGGKIHSDSSGSSFTGQSSMKDFDSSKSKSSSVHGFYLTKKPKSGPTTTGRAFDRVKSNKKMKEEVILSYTSYNDEKVSNGELPPLETKTVKVDPEQHHYQTRFAPTDKFYVKKPCYVSHVTCILACG